jgi:MoaA/NifB/PqqE/SkfB family radical SAM enzyme
VTSAVGFTAEEVRRYGPLARRFFERALQSRVPIAGGMELTHRCNLACLHCYVNQPADDKGIARREMNTTEVCQIIDELADLGTMKLTLTGGEPLLRRDFAEIYRHAHGRGILVVVYTNATLITDRIAELFRECPPAKVEITQYGADAETFNAVADIAGNPFSKFELGIERLRRAGIRFSLKTIAMRRNAHQVADMKRFAENLGVDFRFDTVISPRIDGGRKPLAQRLTPEEVADLDVHLAATPDQWADYCSSRLGTEPADELYRCGAGVATFMIDPYGKLHVCELSRQPGWDVRNQGFAKGWFEEIPALRARKAAPGSTCQGCATEALCPNCVGMTQLEGVEVNPYLCRVTDERNRLALGDDRPTPAGLVTLRRRSSSLATPIGRAGVNETRNH